MQSKQCCDIDPFIKTSYEKDGETVLVMQCRNPQCPNYGNTWEEMVENNAPTA